ncbi:MAG TPA: hypothetical protein VHY56_10075 [Candidatus Binataceae bacterium]|nr:hypothetical protein [Candidatus Binataceae bacterium]
MRTFGFIAATGAALMLTLAAGRGIAQTSGMPQTSAMPETASAPDASATPGALPTPGPNQTLGFGNGKAVLFTYTENFDCVDQPTEDLNFNSVLAQFDPSEMDIPICQPGNGATTFDPTGFPVKKTDKLYVLIPFFSSTNDTNPDDAIPCPTAGVPNEVCGPALGAFLVKNFGIVPEAYEAHPAVDVQCPNPSDPAGSCTMHGDTVDMSLVLAALNVPGFTNPPSGNTFTPLPNHSHLIFQDQSHKGSVWWQVLPVLVTNASDWPPADGSSGITTVKALAAAEANKEAIEVPSNFFLFFGSQIIKTAKN